MKNCELEMKMSKTIAFKDLFEIPLRNGLTKPKKVRGYGYKMVNMGELFTYPIIKNLEMDRVPLKENEKIAFLKNGDLLFARQSLVRSGAGQCSIFIEDNENVCFESHLIRCRLNLKIADPLFYFYFFKSNLGRSIMDTIVEQGAGASGIRGSDLSELQVPYLDLNKQLEISQHLYTLDKKIQLNTQTNQTLEAIAQAIFKSWFVDFDPVRAKAQALSEGKSEREANLSAMAVISGKAIEDLSQTEYQELWEIADAFPSELVENAEFGEVPKGWEVKSLDEIANYQNGLALQKFRPENDDEFLPVVKIAQLRQGYADAEEKARIDIKPECIINNGDVVFSWSGSLLVDFWCGGKAALNQHLFKVTSNNYPKWFYYLWTKHHLAEFQRIAADKAVTMGHIKREHLSQALCAVPDDDFLNLCTLISNNLDLIIANRISNFDLAKARDLLLPRLLSGELLNE